jgi:hypothetical protein
MKNLLVYYLSILIPLLLIVWYSVESRDSATFVILLICYVFYRGFTDGKRLIDKGIIKGDGKWKVFIPFYVNHVTYFKELYLRR